MLPAAACEHIELPFRNNHTLSHRRESLLEPSSGTFAQRVKGPLQILASDHLQSGQLLDVLNNYFGYRAAAISCLPSLEDATPKRLFANALVRWLIAEIIAIGVQIFVFTHDRVLERGPQVIDQASQRA